MAEIIVVHGYAGSGKTTQCERLAREGLEDKSVYHVSAGSRLRAIRNGLIPSDFPELLNPTTLASDLPDPIINQAILAAVEEGSDHDVILSDGYPRFARTVELFHNSLRDNDHELLGTVFLWIPKYVSANRVLGRGYREGEVLINRDKDLESDAKSKYNRDAQRVPRATRALGRIALVKEIDANDTEEVVYSRFRSAIASLALQRETSDI